MTELHGQVGAPTRRGVLGYGAGALGAAVVLAGCGSKESTSTSTTSGAGGGATPSPSGGGGQETTASPGGLKVSDVPVGGGTVLKDQGVVVTQPQAGVFKAFSATCTHQGCTVSSVSGGTINCPCHGSKFNIADGSVANGPAAEPLGAKTVIVTGDTLTVS
jgi:Rieske Fe-S protein